MALRAMSLGQNLHSVTNNCVIVSAPSLIANQASSINGKRQIAPRSSIPLNVTNDNRCRKKYNYTGLQYCNQQSASVARRNARERNRVKQVNNGFANLRQHIPPKVITALTNGGRGANKKLSKVDTLKLAVEYIRSLQRMLDDNENELKESKVKPYYTTAIPCSEASISPVHETDSDTSTSGHSYMHQNHQHRFKSEPYDAYCENNNTSPTPSYTSDGSSAGVIYPKSSTPYKEKYDNYTPMSPEDEMLLDAITWWQEQ